MFMHSFCCCSNSVNGPVRYYQNSGTGTVSSTLTLDTTRNGATRVAAAYLDNDSTLDVVVVFGDSNCVVWYKGTVTGGVVSFSSGTVVSAAVVWSVGLQLIDYDRDGDVDILTSSRTTHSVLVLLNTGNAASFTLSTLDTALTGAQSHIAFDADSDGVWDSISVSWDTGDVRWCVRVRLCNTL